MIISARLLAALPLLLCLAPLRAQVSLTTLGTPYTQTFDTLPASGSATWTNNSTIPGWYHARTGTGTTVVANNGSSNAGNLYSYGTGTATDRALGSLGSGNAAVGNLFWGVRLVNNTGATVTSLDITYRGEQWRNSAAAAQTIGFSYLTGATYTGSLAEFQSAGTSVNALDFTSPITGGAASALDGNLAANRVSITGTISGLSIAPGQEILLRWSDPDHTGADHGLSIDDLSITPQGSGAPVTPTLSINDVSQAEGNAGTTTFTFTVSLTSPAGAGGVTFDIATADNTATVANADYVTRTLTGQSILQGASTFTFDVTVNGDTTVEPNETFFVNLTNIAGANAGDLQGTGTIANDDVSLISISTIQGSGNASPLVGQNVTTEGIVTAVASNGFYIQDPVGDANPATSDGILVFTSSAPPSQAVVGNRVQVAGTVTEFIPSQDPQSRPITELTAPTVTLLTSGNSLPSPVLLNGNLTPAGGPDQLERYEGMLVQVNGLTVVAPTDGNVNEVNATSTTTGVFYGVITGTPIPFREAGIEVLSTKPTCAAGSGCAIPTFDANPERLRIDSDGITGVSALNVTTGNTIATLTGVLTYGFRAYTILPTSAPTVAGSPVTVSPMPIPSAGTVTIAAMNVERLFDNVDEGADPNVTLSAYQGRLQKISATIRNILRFPDVIAFEEVEKLAVLTDLAARITSDAASASQPDPAYTAYVVEGNDPGGIDVGFLVKNTVTAGSVTQLGSTTQYTTPCNTQDLLNDRPPLRLRATANKGGQTLAFTVFVNHLRSLNGIDDESSCDNGPRVRAKRAAQANFLAQQIQDELTFNPNASILAVGDFNDFEVSDGYVHVLGGIIGTPAPATQVAAATADPSYPDLTNMLSLLPAAQRYSYVFDGNHQTLDHVLLNPAARANVVGGGYARVNADHPETLRGNFNTPERFSDHDPAIVYLTSAANVTPQMTVTRSGVIYNRTALTATSTVTVRNNSGQTVTGPLNLVVTGLPAGVTVTNATANNGAGYVFSVATPLAPGQSVAIPLQFSMNAVQAINYLASIFNGSL